jgi:DnaD/phage-associated family protein
MAVAPFDGFPSVTRSVPVPAPLLGQLLAEVDEPAELKCTLRFFWHLAQRHGFDRAIPESTFDEDGVLLSALGSADAVRQGLGLAVTRGTLLAADDAAGHRVYLANSPEGRRAAAALAPATIKQRPRSERQEAGVLQERSPQRSNVFELYETNIGMLTPMLAEELRDAEQTYPAAWIEAAVREAVNNNARSWRYIARVLERWAKEGRGSGANGEPGRHSQALTAAEYRRRAR